MSRSKRSSQSWKEKMKRKTKRFSFQLNGLSEIPILSSELSTERMRRRGRPRCTEQIIACFSMGLHPWTYLKEREPPTATVMSPLAFSCRGYRCRQGTARGQLNSWPLSTPELTDTFCRSVRAPTLSPYRVLNEHSRIWLQAAHNCTQFKHTAKSRRNLHTITAHQDWVPLGIRCVSERPFNSTWTRLPRRAHNSTKILLLHWRSSRDSPPTETVTSLFLMIFQDVLNGWNFPLF